MSEQKSGAVKLSIKEKCGYACTDMAGNLLYVTISSYIMYFYTNVFGIPAAGAWGASIILLVARIADALGAVVWGSVIDHTKSKWGQARPWFVWLFAPFMVTVWLAFFAPGIEDSVVKFWYAFITYILASGVVYTGIQTAITAVLPNMTADADERINANTFRMAGGNIGSFITCSACIPLVGAFGFALTGQTGPEADKVGFMVTIAVFGVLAAAMLIFAFASIREHNFNPKTAEAVPFKDSLRAAKGNWPWLILVIAFVIYWVAQSTRNGMATYYAQYIIGERNFSAIINGIQIIGIAGTFLMPFLVKHTNLSGCGKTNTMMIGLATGAAGQLLIPVASSMAESNPGLSLILFTIFWTIGVIGAAIACGMPFAMLADTVDYGEWKNGIHAAGFLTAVGSAFCIQAGSGFGAYVPLEIMNANGFNAALEAQPASALNAITFCFVFLPVIVYAIVAVIMTFYRKYERMEPKIKEELAKRNAK